MKLLELSAVLEQQFVDLANSATGKEMETLENANTYRIQELSIKVFVKMTRRVINTSYHSSRLNKAVIETDSKDSNVFNVVRDFFNKKELVTDRRGYKGETFRFAEFSINGKTIRDSLERS